MEDLKKYKKARKVSRQLCDLMKQQSPDDLTALKEWLEANEGAGQLIEELMDKDRLTEKIAIYRQYDPEQTQKTLHHRIRRQQRRKLGLRIGKIAALFILLIASATYLRYATSSTSEESTLPLARSFSSPTLITDNGKSIDLSALTGDSLIHISQGQTLSQTKNELKYPVENSEKQSASDKTNQLVIPSQCNYRLVLCDGSIVHLNAESCLEYPTQFPADERKVRLVGEGYFEIRHDGRPFIVETDQIRIRVYGTKFNLKAYEANCIETVLAEGSIGISAVKHPAEEHLLKPNQLSSINSQTGEHIIRDVDIEKYLSWTTGYLQYDHDPLEKLIKDLGRWYGVAFDFANTDLPTIRISASINKDTPLSEVLNMIQTTAKIKFQQQERRYIVSR